MRADGADAKELNPSGLQSSLSADESKYVVHPKFTGFGLGYQRALDRCPVSQQSKLLYIEEQLARLSQQLSNECAFRNRLASIAAMLKRVLIAWRCA